MNSEERKREEVKEILRKKLDSYVGEDFDILKNMVYTCNSYNGNCETISDYEYEQLLIENKEEIIEEYIEGLFEDFNYFIQDICDNELRNEIEELGKIEVE